MFYSKIFCFYKYTKKIIKYQIFILNLIYIMNGIFVFGLIFLLITLCAYPKLVKDVPEGACHQAYEDVEDNKKYFKIFLGVSIGMVIIGGIMMLL